MILQYSIESECYTLRPDESILVHIRRSYTIFFPGAAGRIYPRAQPTVVFMLALPYSIFYGDVRFVKKTSRSPPPSTFPDFSLPRGVHSHLPLHRPPPLNSRTLIGRNQTRPLTLRRVRGCKGGRAHGFPAGAERRDHGGRRGRHRRRCRGRRLPPPPIQEAQGYVRHLFLRTVECG
jgi:hypothetical protein